MGSPGDAVVLAGSDEGDDANLVGQGGDFEDVDSISVQVAAALQTDSERLEGAETVQMSQEDG